MIHTRRKFLTGLGSLLAAPAIVHAGNLMPVKALRVPLRGSITEIYNNRTIRFWIDIETIQDRNILLRIDDYTVEGKHFTPLPFDSKLLEQL